MPVATISSRCCWRAMPRHLHARKWIRSPTPSPVSTTIWKAWKSTSRLVSPCSRWPRRAWRNSAIPWCVPRHVDPMDELLIAPRPASLDGQPQCWLVFFQGRLLLPREGFPAFPESRIHTWLSPSPLVEHYVGRLGSRHCLAVDLPDDAELPDGYDLLDLRQLLGIFDAPSFAVASRAIQVVTWYRNHRFCSRCGTASVPHLRDFAMVCPQCDYAQYPRITPCVIM